MVEVAIDVTILKWILKTYGISMWTGFIRLKKRSTAGSVKTLFNFVFCLKLSENITNN